MMKSAQAKFFFYGTLVMPWVALAHGGVDDGHVEDTLVAHPEQRTQVAIGVAVVALLLIGFIWYAKRNNAPSASQNNGGSGTPSSVA